MPSGAVAVGGSMFGAMVELAQVATTEDGPLTVALERGDAVRLTDRSFLLSPAETAKLDETLAPRGVKNISFDPARPDDAPELLRRFSAWARDTVSELAPAYAPHLVTRRASLRVRAIDDAPLSPRRDDRRLHVDAFESQPQGGQRILRLFANVNPHGQDRVWRLGERFEAHARRFLPRARRPWPLEARLLAGLGITKTRRSPYDHLMLQLHDHAKLDADYQAAAPTTAARFGPGEAWLVFTDQVVHAAMAGQYMLEQTFQLPVAALGDPASAPLSVLERLTGRKLT
jgi:3-deoxy-D-manno-oct-2-ulosonic acid (Kdo) hydroxylase